MLTKNPFRRGGGLDLTTGMTRTAARVVLDRNGIKVPDRADVSIEDAIEAGCGFLLLCWTR